MAVTAREIRDRFLKAYPDELIVVYRYAAPGGCCSCLGIQLLGINLGGNEWLDMFKLHKSAGACVNEEEITSKAHPFVYETRDIRDHRRRRDILKNNLKNVFPNHYVHIFLFKARWTRSSQNKGAASFRNDYGHDVDIILS